MKSSSNLNGLSSINIELTNRCNKKCWMCPRSGKNMEKGKLMDIGYNLIKSISKQLPPGIVVQLHRDGESLLYPRFGEVVSLFGKQIICLTTNGKLLVKKSKEIIGKVDSLCLSIFEKDDEQEQQIQILEDFLRVKGDMKPIVILKLLGKVDENVREHLEGLAKKHSLTITTRTIHEKTVPGENAKYRQPPVIPETGICRDFLNHPCVTCDGMLHICPRFDPDNIGALGDLKKDSLASVWNGTKRKEWLEAHKKGRRDMVPLCAKCTFWGVPTSS